MTIVIVDGPRGSGKTSLLDAVESELGKRGQEYSRFKHERGSDPFADMVHALADFTSQPDIVWLCDRFLLTEYVFSIWKNRMPITTLVNKSIHISNLIAMVDAVHLVLMADPEVIEERLADRPEERKWDMPKDLYAPIWKASIGVCPSAVMVYNNDESDQALIIKHILNRVQSIKKEQAANG